MNVLEMETPFLFLRRSPELFFISIIADGVSGKFQGLYRGNAALDEVAESSGEADENYSLNELLETGTFENIL